jgi:hypothetical protein
MDKIPVRIMNTINKYINELEKNKVYIQRASGQGRIYGDLL